MKYFLKYSCFIFLIVCLHKANAQNTHPDFWDGTAYVKFSGHVLTDININPNDDITESLTTKPELAEIIGKFNIVSVKKAFKTPALKHIYKITFGDIERADELVRELELLNCVVYAHKSPIYKLFYTPDDVHANQWYFNLISAYDAWGLTTGSSNIKVAIVDDAVKISHPDLSPIIYSNPNEVLDSTDSDGNGFIDDINGWDVSDNNNNPEPPASHWMYGFSDLIFTHGTHCAGIAGAATDNGIGIASIGFGIRIIPVKAMSNSSILPLALDAGPEGIDYAIAAGADVISLSWGSAQNVQAVRDIVELALNSGIIVVAAAGNDGNSSLMYPASIDGVISVGAITHNDIIASFSQRNDKISVMAPGDQIWSTVRKNDGYAYLEGTSMATPMVAGLIGLMKSYDTTLTNTDIIDCLIASCDNIDSLNPSAAGLMGAGRINAHKALLCLQNNQSAHFSLLNEDVLLFPNPVPEELFVSFDKKSNMSAFIIYDLIGRNVYEKNISTYPNGRHNIRLNLSELNNGIYFFNVLDGYSKSVFNQKIIKL